MKLLKKNIVVILLSCMSLFAFSQDLENAGKDLKKKIGEIGKGKAFKIGGGISANGVFYNSDLENNSREPFTYFLQGNLNLGFLSWSMPISYSFTNQGSALDYEIPFKFNRITLNPKYKWIQGYIGDVTMNFSPYTLNGFQFTGAGVELTPDIPLKLSLLGGQFLKAVEDNEDPRTIPSFKRMGYGAKIGLEKDNYTLGVTGFYAKDDLHSISTVPDEKEVTPKENLVVSFDGKIKLTENVEFYAEYASTAITHDLRAEKTSEGESGIAALFFSGRGSTEYYDAYKTGLQFQQDKTTFGVQYERIDPGYETLGAYYFNNDFENITVNASRTFWKDKINLALNVGYQRDDLDNQKEAETGRTVGSINVTVQATDKLSITTGYSNFTTFTNVKLNQFEEINDPTLIDNATDTLDYKQISQNFNIGINYAIAQTENLTQNINMNYNGSDVANEQDGIVRIGQASLVHNANLAYQLGFPKKNIDVVTTLNYTNNTIGREDTNTYGGGINVTKKFFENKLNTSFGVNYNQNESITNDTSLLNFRLNSSYTLLEKHNLNLSANQMFRSTSGENSQNLNELTVTVGYNYRF